MDTYERAGMRRYYFPYLIAQALGYVLVAALTITDSEMGTRDIVESILCAPAIALLFRFFVYLYRVIRIRFGWIISFFGVFIGMTCIFTAIVRIVYVSPISTYTAILQQNDHNRYCRSAAIDCDYNLRRGTVQRPVQKAGNA